MLMSDDDEIQELQWENQSLTDQLSKLKAENEALKSQVRGLERNYKARGMAMEDLAKSIYILEAQLKSAECPHCFRRLDAPAIDSE
jgi:predicted RNase H-like nuclease (RuvC/YqgF family)